MSLSPLVSFKSQFVTYLLDFFRIIYIRLYNVPLIILKYLHK